MKKLLVSEISSSLSWGYMWKLSKYSLPDPSADKEPRNTKTSTSLPKPVDFFSVTNFFQSLTYS